MCKSRSSSIEEKLMYVSIQKHITFHSMICSWPSSCLLEILLGLSKSKYGHLHNVCRFVTK